MRDCLRATYPQARWYVEVLLPPRKWETIEIACVIAPDGVGWYCVKPISVQLERELVRMASAQDTFPDFERVVIATGQLMLYEIDAMRDAGTAHG